MFSLIALLSLAVAPAALLIHQLAVPWYFVFWGAATWGVAVALKRPLAAQLSRRLRNRGRLYVATAQGLLSAVLELGVAALYLWRVKGADVYSIIGFGSGAGTAEICLVVVLSVREKDDSAREAEWLAKARQSLCVRHQVAIERFFACVGHIGTRGLIYVGLNVGIPGGSIILLAALAFFAFVDGVAMYGHLCGWDWFDPHRCRTVHLIFASVSLLELTLFLVVFQLSHLGQ